MGERPLGLPKRSSVIHAANDGFPPTKTIERESSQVRSWRKAAPVGPTRGASPSRLASTARSAATGPGG